MFFNISKLMLQNACEWKWAESIAKFTKNELLIANAVPWKEKKWFVFGLLFVSACFALHDE